MIDVANGIFQVMDTDFYTFHADEMVALGVQTRYGVYVEEFLKPDYIDWLREELRRCKPTEVPTYLK